MTARAEYLSLLEIGSGQRVLDIGCGSGVIARDVARRVQPNGRVVGIDSSPALIAAARELTTATDGATSITFREGDCRALPLADDSFDVVIAATVLTHVPDGHRAILEMARVVRPGGRVGVFDFDGDGVLLAHPDRDMTRRIVAAFSDHSAVNGWLVREPEIVQDTLEWLKDIRVRGFMPLEQHEGSFYARMGERAAAVALEVGAITPEQHEKWMEALRDRVHSGEFLGGRLHLFCWGRKP